MSFGRGAKKRAWWGRRGGARLSGGGRERGGQRSARQVQSCRTAFPSLGRPLSAAPTASRQGRDVVVSAQRWPRRLRSPDHPSDGRTRRGRGGERLAGWCPRPPLSLLLPFSRPVPLTSPCPLHFPFPPPLEGWRQGGGAPPAPYTGALPDSEIPAPPTASPRHRGGTGGTAGAHRHFTPRGRPPPATPTPWPPVLPPPPPAPAPVTRRQQRHPTYTAGTTPPVTLQATRGGVGLPAVRHRLRAG